MKEVYLEQRGASEAIPGSGLTEHNKFFKLVDDGKKVVSFWGPIGAKGQSKVLVESDDAAVRQAAWDKKFKEKTARKQHPYVVITKKDGDSQVQVESRPSVEGRRWGLEVETHSHLDISDVVSRLEERGLKVNDSRSRYFHSDGSKWDIKRDGSCGYEFASPILSGDAGIFDAKLAVEKIREVSETAVNQQCGIHVTIDVSDHSKADLKRLAIGYLRAQEHFYAQCAPWRQSNRYCARNPVTHLMDMVNMSPSLIETILNHAGGWRNHNDRYHGLNWTRVFSNKVVEFRMMESSVQIRKVGGWIRTCVGFVDGLKKSDVTFKSATPFSAETFEKIVAGTFQVS